MKRLSVLCLVGLLACGVVYAAAPQQRRGQSASSVSAATSGASTRTNTVAARSATTARSATAPRATSSASNVTARAATTGRTTVNRGTTSATTTGARSGVSARAATTQKVIGTGTKVASKYMGCMDSFCMLDNDSGGRCICSDRNAELDAVLTEIEKLDQQSYQMATVGIDSIENDYDINAVYSQPEEEKSGLNLDLWNISFDDDTDETESILDQTGDALFRGADEICAAAIPECASSLNFLRLAYNQQINNDCAAYENSLDQMRNESNQKLQAARMGLVNASYTAISNANKYDLGQCTVEFKNCMIDTGGCGADFSGCASVAAFDTTNTRGRGVNARPHVIQGAKTNIEIQASTYDILMSKKPLCDSVTQNCQDVADQVWDTFLRESAPAIKNAELIAEDNARQNCVANISDCFQQACKDNIDPNDPDGSYDLCLTRPEAMLNLCTVPLNACGISTASAQDAAASPIWEYVLARLASMRVNECTTQFKECLQSEDRCGPDYTQCVGLDTDTIMRICPYETLVGCQHVYGDTNIQGDAVYDELYNVAQGIFLNIDNEMLDYCQAALDQAVITACGDADTCDKFLDDPYLGAQSLNYKICEYAVGEDNQLTLGNCRTSVAQVSDAELGRVVGATTNALGPITPLGGVIEGTIYWDGVTIGDDGNICSTEKYFENIGLGADKLSEYDIQVISSQLNMLRTDIDQVFDIIESDPTVQFCTTGRRVDGMAEWAGEQQARFPELTSQIKQKITQNALKRARANYYEKYDELTQQQQQDYTTITERMAEIRGENGKDARRDAARQACVDMAQLSGMGQTKTPTSLTGIITISAIAVAASVVLTVFTAGAGLGVVGGVIAANLSQTATATTLSGMVAAATSVSTAAEAAAILAGTGAALTTAQATALATASTIVATTQIISGTVAGGAVAAGVSMAATADWQNEADHTSADSELTGYYENEQWNYKETITTMFDMDTLVCHKCSVVTNCAQTKTPFFGDQYCSKWETPVETCTDISF